jgi:hypothetical protein
MYELLTNDDNNKYFAINTYIVINDDIAQGNSANTSLYYYLITGLTYGATGGNTYYQITIQHTGHAEQSLLAY